MSRRKKPKAEKKPWAGDSGPVLFVVNQLFERFGLDASPATARDLSIELGIGPCELRRCLARLVAAGWLRRERLWWARGELAWSPINVGPRLPVLTMKGRVQRVGKRRH